MTSPPPRHPKSQKVAFSTPRETSSTQIEKCVPENKEEGIVVAIRMRPLNSKETTSQTSDSDNSSRVWKVLPKWNAIAQTTSSGEPLPNRVAGRNFFTYDKTFGETSSTLQVYDGVAQTIVQGVVGGLNGTIFAYGQTSSGKTFTMQGSGSIEEGHSTGGGIVHMATKDIFAHIAKTPDRAFLVRTSFIEIYNEEVRDLLGGNEALQVREDPRRGVFVNSKEEIVTDFDSLLGVLFSGEKNRAVASTSMNVRSSRSHTIFRITIESRRKVEGEDDSNEEVITDVERSEADDGAVRISTLNLVDLAGSESVRHTGATGDRQKEGGKINQSLLTLSRVIVALGQPNQPHVNFRDSKLTRILQPSLSGNARMAVVCCATPSELYLEETRSTLLFASRAKLVKTNAQVNEVLDDRSLIKRLQRELAEARQLGGGQNPKHVQALKREAAQAGTAAKVAEEKLTRLKASLLNNNAFFGTASDDITQNGPSRKKRKRRHSDGALDSTASILSPSHGTKRNSAKKELPKSASRSSGTGAAPWKSVKRLSPTSELSLFKQAFAAKVDHIESLRQQVKQADEFVANTKLDLSQACSEVKRIREEKDSAEMQNDSLSSSIRSLTKAHEDDIAEKEAMIETTLEKLNTNVAKQKELELSLLEAERSLEAMTSEQAATDLRLEEIEREKDQLQTRFDQVSEERVRSAFELAQANSEKDRYVREREEDKEKLQLLTSTMQEAIEEKDEAARISQKLESEIKLIYEEKDVAVKELERSKASHLERCTELKTLQSTYSDLQSEKHELLSQLEAEQQSNEIHREELKWKAAIIEDFQAKIDAGSTEIRDLKERVEDVTLSQQKSEEELLLKLSSEQNTSESLRTERNDLLSTQENLLRELETERERSRESQREIGSLNEKLLQSDDQMSALQLMSKNLREQLEKSRGNEQNTKDKLTDMDQKQEAAMTALALAEVERKGIDNMCSQQREELVSLREKLTAITNEKDTLVAKCTSMECENENTRAELDQEKQVKKALEAKNGAIQNALNALMKEKDVLSEQLKESSDTQRDISEQRRSVEERSALLISKNESLSRELADRETDLEKASTKLLEIAEYSREQEKKLNASEEELVRLEATVKDFEGKAAKFESQVHSTLTEVESLKNTNRQLNLQLVDVTTKAGSLESSNESLKSNLFEADSKVAGLKLECHEINSLLSARDEELRETREIISSLSTQVQELKTCNLELESKNEAYLVEHSAKNDELAKANGENAALSKTIEETQAQIVVLKEEHAEIAKQLDDKHSEMVQIAAISQQSQTAADETKLELSSKVSLLEAESADNALKIEAESQAKMEALAEVNILTTEKTELTKQLEGAKLQLEKYRHENENLSGKVDDISQLVEQEKSVRDREKSEMKQLRETISIVTSSKEDVECRLKIVSGVRDQVAGQLNEMQTKVMELERQLDQKSKEVQESVIGNENLKKLEEELLETRSLLAAVNESDKEARDVAESLHEELQDKEVKLSEALQLLAEQDKELRAVKREANAVQEQDGFTNSDRENQLLDELERLTVAVEKAETDLALERDERATEKSHFERRMGEEQSQLIREAEEDMKRLRDEVNELKENLADSEAEALSARQEVEERRDQMKSLETTAIAGDKRIMDLRDELRRSAEAERRLKMTFASELGMPSLASAAGPDLSDVLANSMRMKVNGLKEKRLSAEADARNANMQLMKVTDERSNLRMTLEEIKGTMVTQKAKYETEMLETKAELKRTKAENFSAKQEVTDLNNAIVEIRNEREESSREIEKLRVINRDLETQFAILQEESRNVNEHPRRSTRQSETDKVQLEATVAELEESVRERDTKIKKYKKAVKEKDARIAKLDATRITRDQVKALSKIKAERVQYMEEASEAKNKLTSAKEEIELLKAKVRTNSENDEAATDLRFAKDALETKLRKYAGHCKRLEEEKGSIIDVLVSCIGDKIADNDIVGAVVRVCDKLNSLEEECDALASAEEKSGSYLAELEQLRSENEGLQKSASIIENEKSRKVRHLEKENLQLMVDLRETKDRLRGTKQELENLRLTSAGIDDDLTLGTLDGFPGLAASESMDSQKAMTGKLSGRGKQLEVERSTNHPISAAKDLTNKQRSVRAKRSSKKKQLMTPGKRRGLGEAAEANDENSNECNQS